MASLTPILAEEELVQLPPRAQLAVAARTVWRLLPQLIDLNAPEAATELRLLTAALMVVDMTAVGRYGAAGGPEALGDLLQQSRALRKRMGLSGILSDVADPLTDSALGVLTEASSPADESSSHLGGLMQLFASFVPEDAVEPLRQDFAWLSEWAAQKRAMDGMVPSDFFRRPLWERSEGWEPPKSRVPVIEEWSKQVGEMGPGWLPEIYHALLGGKGPDWKFFGEALSELRGFIEQQAKSDAQTEQSEEEEAPTTEESELLKGGTVTAAADTPALEDRLGRTPLVRTLADMLSSPDQPLPMTIALLGDWGSGKSSVIAQLQERLQKLANRPGRTRYLVAEFNAWAYEQTDNLQAGLAQEVVRGLTRGLGWGARFSLAVRNASSRHGWGFYRTVLYLLGTLVLTALGVLNADKLGQLNPMSQSLLGTGGAAVLVFALVRSWQQLRRFMEHPLAERLSTYLQLPNYGEHLGQVPVIKEEIRSLCTARLGAKERLLVVVDDLDRCQPRCITETLDAIRLVMDLERAAVIVAIDDRIAFRAVAEHYRQLAEDGRRSKEEIARDYLGKIIQLPVNLYEPWHWEVSRFIKDRLFIVEEESVPPPTEPATTSEETPLLSEAARELVRRHQLDPLRITGSGQNGRILKKDVEAYLDQPLPADGDMDEMGTLIDRPNGTPSPAPPPGEKSLSADTEETAEGLMQDTAFERDLFADLARDMRFHNPRQLIRLRNSYRLLKGYRHNRKGGELSRGLVDSLMHGLFWYEHLYRQQRDDRQRAEIIVWEWSDHPEWEQRAGQQKENPPAVNMARRLMARLPADGWEREYHRLLRTVEMVVLPNADMGLLLSRAQVDEVLKGLSTADTPSLDPWTS